MVPWGQAFGWSRQTISLAVAIGIFLFGLTGPFAAAAMQRFGVRPTVMVALAMMAVSSAVSLFMTAPWQLILTWGVISGIGSGCITNVLAATIVNRWFVTNRGLIMGLFAASTSTGTLVFIPALSAIAESHGWKPVVLCVAIAMVHVRRSISAPILRLADRMRRLRYKVQILRFAEEDSYACTRWGVVY